MGKTKIEILLLEAPPEADLEAHNAFHDVRVTLSLDIIECHQLYQADECLKPWRWHIRHTHQWFATVYVLEELARRPYAAFAPRAWQLLDLVMGDIEVLDKHGMQPKNREKLLEAHANALQAREELLRGQASSSTGELLMNHMITEEPGSDPIAKLDYNSNAPMRSEPWQFDQSLFDVEHAQLNFDALFWPSNDSPTSQQGN